MTRTLSLKTKLVSSFGLVAFFLLGVGAFAFYALDQVSDDFDHVANVTLPNALLVADLRSDSMAIVRNITYLALPDLSAEDLKEYKEKLRKRTETFNEAEKLYSESDFAPGEEPLFRDTVEKWKSARAEGDKILALARSGSPKDREEMDRLLRTTFDDEVDAYVASINELLKFQKKEAVKWQAAAHVAATHGKESTGTIAIAGFFLAFAFGWLVSRQLSNSLSALTEKLNAGAAEVGSASHELSAASEELSSSTAQQAASLQETTASVEEINAMIGKNAQSTDRSREVSKRSSAVAEEGKKILEQLTHSTQAISESNARIMNQVESGNREIAEIVQVINEIGNKTKVINDIVFQTKLLSFNASVEAARAGENGKGFAVVAEEVGSLAQMSGNAAKEISDLLEGSTQKVERIVRDTSSKVGALIAEGKEKVEDGARIAVRCDEVFRSIASNISQVDRLVEEISSASKEQSQGVGEINKAMNQLDQATQQNAAVSQQAATASTELSMQADSLRALVVQVNVLVQGSAAVSSSPVVAMPRTGRRMNPAAAEIPSSDDVRFVA